MRALSCSRTCVCSSSRASIRASTRRTSRPRPSDAIVARGVGGRVTREVINTVAFIGQIAENVLPEGPLFEVTVIHHNQCGTGALADDTFRRRYAERIGADESALLEQAILDLAATVKSDVERLRAADAVPPRVTVSGHVYDVTTALVQTILPARCACQH
jgi:carbonic anhydrase